MAGISVTSQKIIDDAAVAAGIAGVAGGIIPVVDIPAMSVIWVKMLNDLGKASHHEVNGIFRAKFALSIIAGASAYWSGCKLFTYALSLIPGAGSVVSAAINAVFNWFFTRSLGRWLAEQFETPGFTAKMLIGSALKTATFLTIPLGIGEISEGLTALSHVLHLSPEMHDHILTVVEHSGLLGDAHGHASAAVDAASQVHETVNHVSAAHETVNHVSAAHETVQHAISFGSGNLKAAISRLATGEASDLLKKLIPIAEREAPNMVHMLTSAQGQGHQVVIDALQKFAVEYAELFHKIPVARVAFGNRS